MTYKYLEGICPTWHGNCKDLFNGPKAGLVIVSFIRLLIELELIRQ